MDKLELLRELGKLVAGNDLDADEIRLCLLLLTNCGGSRNGEIEYGTIKSAIGQEFSLEKLKKSCRRLFMYNLIAVTSPFPEGIKEENFIIFYKVFPAREN
jgi:hypothetical protein